jgi:uncharacterized protein YbjT (DUF2867 family)
MSERPTSRVLVAGASGYLGRHVVGELHRRGYLVRALIRDPDKRSLVEGAEETLVIDLLKDDAQLHDAMEDIDVVLSTAGQPCTLQRIADHRSFREVDPQINRALLDAAITGGIEKFVYVTVFAPPQLHGLDYVASHEGFIDELKAGRIEYTVVSANGFFYSYLDLLEVARRGLAIGFGDGSARSNPIHEADLAIACVEAMEGTSRRVEVGGPEIITRSEEAKLAFAAVGRKPHVLRIPKPLLKAALPLIKLTDRRRGEMLDFLAAISHIDLLAPQHGSRRLADYLREHA